MLVLGSVFDVVVEVHLVLVHKHYLDLVEVVVCVLCLVPGDVLLLLQPQELQVALRHFQHPLQCGEPHCYGLVLRPPRI